MKSDQELAFVKYFSARPENHDKFLRQNSFFQANQENPKFQLILGKYLRKTIKCYNCGYLIQTYEEKESDVRIATQIVDDANNHAYVGLNSVSVVGQIQSLGSLLS